MIDTNVSLFRWPCRRLPLDDTKLLIDRLKRVGMTQAWAGSFEALLHEDIGGVNLRLAEECQTSSRDFLIPFGTVNPALPDWPEDLSRCHEVHKMKGIRVHPNYHGYKLDDPEFLKLVELTADRSLILQISVAMEDERTQHPLLRVSPVDLRPLTQILEKMPRAKICLSNAGNKILTPPLNRLIRDKLIWTDIAMLEGVFGIERALKALGSERIMLGTHSPFYAIESSILKIKESQLSAESEAKVKSQNALGLFTL